MKCANVALHIMTVARAKCTACDRAVERFGVGRDVKLELMLCGEGLSAAWNGALERPRPLVQQLVTVKNVAVLESFATSRMIALKLARGIDGRSANVGGLTIRRLLRWYLSRIGRRARYPDTILQPLIAANGRGYRDIGR